MLAYPRVDRGPVRSKDCYSFLFQLKVRTVSRDEREPWDLGFGDRLPDYREREGSWEEK